MSEKPRFTDKELFGDKTAEVPQTRVPTKNDLKRHGGTKFSRFRVVKGGLSTNPITKLPRNMRCPCHSGKRFKACCLLDTPPYVPTENLEIWDATYRSAMAGDQAW